MYAWLDLPVLYRLAQRVLAPGADARIATALASVLNQAPRLAWALDVGCGPSSNLRRFGLDPFVLDINPGYAKAHGPRGRALVGTACRLPFRDGCFDIVWSCGLMHHLRDEEAGQAVSEMRRVARPGGCVIVFDAVLPISALRSPLAHAIRKLDRGGQMRSEDALRQLLEGAPMAWRTRRLTYTRTGLEGLLAVAHKD